MKSKCLFLFALVIMLALQGIAQTLAGNAAYNFIQLPNTPQLSALGGINISTISNDAGMAFNNPALLRAEMHKQFHASFNNMYAGIKNYHSYFAYRANKWKTNFGLGIHYLNYGNITQTDAAGNISGSFKPTDYVVQATTSKKYANKWYYGITLKLIHSNYGIYTSSAIAMDAGVCYYDSARFFQASLVLKNMGTQIKKYLLSTADDLPFDVQMGITKKLANAPVQFSLTAHHLHQFNIRYNDSSFNNANGFSQSNNEKTFTIDKIFRHIIVGAQIYVSNKIELTFAYNYLSRKELNIGNTTNGLIGFSLGAGALFKQIQIRYARSYYQNNTAYNQLGLNLLFFTH